MIMLKWPLQLGLSVKKRSKPTKKSGTRCCTSLNLVQFEPPCSIRIYSARADFSGRKHGQTQCRRVQGLQQLQQLQRRPNQLPRLPIWLRWTPTQRTRSLNLSLLCHRQVAR